MTALRLDAFDNVGTDVTMTMTFDPFGSSSPTLMGSVASTGTPGVVNASDVTIANAVVNNAANAYALRMCMNSGLIFYDARIDYTL